MVKHVCKKCALLSQDLGSSALVLLLAMVAVVVSGSGDSALLALSISHSVPFMASSYWMFFPEKKLEAGTGSLTNP